MSQLTKIMSVRVDGAAYLGERAFGGQVTADGTNRVDTWSGDGAVVMEWLCDASRLRFNQHRSTRNKYVYQDGERVLDDAGEPVLVPIGVTVDRKTDAVARREHPHLAAVPAMVLQGQQKIEHQQWFAAAKRRRTNRLAGRPGGKMPSFRAVKHTDLTFSCWRHMGAAEFRRTGKHTGIVTIAGRNPATKKGPAPRCAWRVLIRVRFSADTTIRDYTSVKVNWTRRTLSFTNAPLPIAREITGRAGGFDMGIAHTLADDLGNFLDAPDTIALEAKRKDHQRRMAKSRKVAKQQHRRHWESGRYQAHTTAAAKLSAKITRIRVDFAHKVTTNMVRDCDLIVIEDLQLRKLTKSAKGTVTEPGRNVRQKTGLNRVLAAAGLGRIRQFLTYKADLAGVPLITVIPHNTSRRCRVCGHTAKENRESQAVFRCTACGHTANADTNAGGEHPRRRTHPMGDAATGAAGSRNRGRQRGRRCPQVTPHNRSGHGRVGKLNKTATPGAPETRFRRHTR